MTAQLFPAEAPKHDPGGKVKTKLPAGMVGDAEFYGTADLYRLWLDRWWGYRGGGYALWIGMNPSTAEASFNDPTVTREVIYTQRHLCCTGYVKCNVMDIRCTKPRALLDVSGLACSDRNIPTIIEKARDAVQIVVCYGALHPKLQHHADRVVARLLNEGHELWCLGLTNGGHPRHPLYVKGDTELERFR